MATRSDRPRLTRAARRDRWRGHVADYADSSLTQQEFCASRDLALSSFTRWRRLILAEPPTPSAPSVTPESPRVSAFVPVRMEPDRSAPRPALSVPLPSGVRIDGVESAANVALVAALAAAL